MALRRATTTTDVKGNKETEQAEQRETQQAQDHADSVANEVQDTVETNQVDNQTQASDAGAGDDSQGSEDGDDAAAAAGTTSQPKEAAAKSRTAPTGDFEPELKPEPSQPLAARQEGSVATATKGASAQFTNSMAEQGFEGMELTGMSFDRLKLDEGKFVLGSEEITLGEVIHVNIMSTRNIYVVRQHSGQKAEMFYSYDPEGKFKADGTSAAELLAEWATDGYPSEDEPLQIKKYIEGMAQLVNREDEYEGHMVSLSIPPASGPRLAGSMAVGQRKFNCGPSDLITKCTVGAKIGKGDEAFRPWVFAADGVMA